MPNIPKIKLERLRSLPRRTQLALAAAAIVLAGLTWFSWVIFTPVDPSAAKQVVTVSRGDGLSQVTETLRQEHIIRYPRLFAVWMWLSGSAHRIQPGSYEFSGAQNYREIRSLLISGGVGQQRVTVPEGWTVSEIAAQLGKQGIVDPKAFVEAAKAANFPDLVRGIDPTLSLEGYLFPDTYFFQINSDPKKVISTMLSNFVTRVEPLGAEITKSGLTTAQIVTLASIVEREARAETDMRLVADILVKRLKGDIPLQADATSLYEIGDWKHQLTDADLKKSTPYNTRVNKGLPPTPISNPGLAAIKAVLTREPSPYLYYITDKEGKMHYARTQAEHDANVARYLR